MTDSRRRPVSSWPASLLPSLTLLALLSGGVATTTSSSETPNEHSPVIEMTVSTAP